MSPSRTRWIDYNGHVSEPYYVLVMGHATDAVMAALGMGPDYQSAHDSSFYTVEAHVRYLAEIRSGLELEVRSSVIGYAGKLAWFWHELWADDELRATEEILGVHVTAGAATPFPADVLARSRRSPSSRPSRRVGASRLSRDVMRSRALERSERRTSGVRNVAGCTPVGRE